jgi:hypothetical protein
MKGKHDEVPEGSFSMKGTIGKSRTLEAGRLS